MDIGSSSSRSLLFILIPLLFIFTSAIAACSNGNCKLLDPCSSDQDCEAGLYCFSCKDGPSSGSVCVRSTITDQFKLLNNSLPFNKYAFLATHNSFAIDGEPSHTGIPRLTPTNQEDTVTQQLNNGVRTLLLDTYDFDDTVWLCHSFGRKCHDYTAFEPAMDTMKEIEAFMSQNLQQIVTLILEDYVKSPNGLTNIFRDSGLMKYMFPLKNMPKKGQGWPLVSDMVANNQRLLVFTSNDSKEQTEGIAYQWNYMVENQYGNGGMKAGSCPNRDESSPLDDKSKSLVFLNYFPSIPNKQKSCVVNSDGLLDMLKTCHATAGNRWANFIAVDYYKRSEGRGAFQAVDTLNGEMFCGCDEIHACVNESASGACTDKKSASSFAKMRKILH